MSETPATEDARKPSTMVDVMKFFEMKPAQFKAEWSKLTDKDKDELKKWLDDLRDMIEEHSGE